ncbi:MAG: thioredoxin family protein [Actinomycetota bacterium]|nr:thioredoxin family protein [Actinomycetota bacterium]
MRIELLYFDGCPSDQAFLPRRQELLANANVTDPVQLRRAESDEEATAARFLGSPSLRVDGVGVEPGASQRTDTAYYGMECRLYRTPEGLRGVLTSAGYATR